ncbi:hypothetical protein C8Q70DRAFT_1083895 [Cubamyces menziesii]|nr:hypothetical protein C8Q70DRAFT_1083895 [Cubamyces menziesii]
MQKKQAFSPIWASTLAAIFLRTVLVRDGSPTADAVASKERANARAVIMPRLAQPLRTAERCPNVGLETRSLASVPRGAAHRWNATGYRLPLEARAAGPDLPDTHYTHFHLKRDGRSGHFGRTPSPLRSVMAVRHRVRTRVGVSAVASARTEAYQCSRPLIGRPQLCPAPSGGIGAPPECLDRGPGNAASDSICDLRTLTKPQRPELEPYLVCEVLGASS